MSLHRRRFGAWAVAASTSLVAMQGCSAHAPLRLGFLGGLRHGSGGLGESGRNGATLAIEERNSAGGVLGQAVHLQVEDSGQSAAEAQEAMRRLLVAGLDAVIGPFTSALAEAVVPLANQGGLLLLSPTVTSMDFVGRDDMLVRIHRSTRDNASDYARLLQRLGLRRASLAFDQDNRSFSRSWVAEFQQAHQTAGGALLPPQAFSSAGAPGFDPLARALLAPRPDVVLLVANATDAARLGQRVRLQAPGQALAAAEWAATDVLIELGGREIDGLMVLQPFDRAHTGVSYQRFLAAYRQRFAADPAFAAVAAHDAATVLMDAAARRPAGEALKIAVLSRGPFAGLQQDIQFDAHGDTQRKVVFTEVRGGLFKPLAGP